MKLNILDEVCEFQSGLWTGKKGPYNDVKVLRNTNFTKDNKLNLENIAEIKVEVKQLEKRVLKEGDILIEKSGGGPNQPVGRVVFIDKRAVDYSFSNFTSRIRVTSGTLNPNYLYWFLNYIYLSGKTENLQRRSTGIRNLQLKDYKQLAIPVPSLQEQEKIVERLDKAFNYTDLNLKNIEHTDFEIDKLFGSIIHEIFLEKEVRLGSLIELNYGKDLDKKERGDKFKIPLYGSNGIMDFASKPLHYDKSIIVGRKGSVGELQFVEVPFWVIDVGFYVTLANKDHLMRYYYYLLKSLNLQNLATGVKPGLNRNKVYEILVPKHNLSQQKKIVDKLDKLFLLKHEMQNVSTKKTTSNSLLKRSILNKEFAYE